MGRGLRAVATAMTAPVVSGAVPATAVTQDPARRAGASTTVGKRLFRPGWPLAAILVPVPLWWALGVTEWIVPVMAVPMILHLLRVRGGLVPRGFGWWMAFLLWVVAGGLLLQVDALGAVAEANPTRLITFGYRLGWYLSITVVLLYVVNTRREISSTRIVRMVAALFLTVTVGGLLGVLAPYFQFRSVAELLLPAPLANVSLIQTMVHPSAAQLQGVLGYVAPRPSAPFAYTNTWGLNFALTLPFFLWGWTGRDAGWRRWAAGPILLVAAVPGIYSLNRGMWGATVAMALFVAVRAAFTGKPRMLAGVVAGAGVLALVLAVSPLGTIVSLRFSNEGSKQVRTNLSALTARSVTATSPIVGLGSTRNVQGNFQSITGGSTAQCPRCSPPSLGTQGQLWLVVFSQGLVGLALFGLFFALVFLRHLRLRSPVVTVALATLVGWLVTLPVYNSLGLGMLVVMIAAALLCREGRDEVGRPATQGNTSLTSLRRYTTALWAGAPILVVLILVGTAAGWWWHQLRPTPYTATASVWLPEPPRYPSPGYVRTNVDTDAQLVASTAVRSAATTASGRPPIEVADNLTVTATPNTRILHLRFTAPAADAARAGVDAAATALRKQRGRRLEADRSRELARLKASASTVEAGIERLNRQLATAASLKVRPSYPSTAVTRNHRNQLLARAALIGGQSARISGLVLTGGRRTGPTVVSRSSDPFRVDLVSGATVGLALGGLLAVLWAAGGPRLRRVVDVRAGTGLALLGRVPATPHGVSQLTRLFADQPMTFIAASEGDATAAAVADQLADSLPRPRRRVGAVVVASGQTRVEQVLACLTRLARQGVSVRGLVIVTGDQRRSRRLGR